MYVVHPKPGVTSTKPFLSYIFHPYKGIQILQHPCCHYFRLSYERLSSAEGDAYSHPEWSQIHFYSFNIVWQGLFTQTTKGYSMSYHYSHVGIIPCFNFFGLYYMFIWHCNLPRRPRRLSYAWFHNSITLSLYHLRLKFYVR